MEEINMNVVGLRRSNIDTIIASMASMGLLQGTDGLFDALSLINEFEDTVLIDGQNIYI